MNFLFKPIFFNLIKKKEVKIFLAFSTFPLLLIIVDMFNTNFMQLSAPNGALSFFEFFGAVEFTQYQMLIPTIAFLYIISLVFNEEIHNGIMFLYKDLNRRTILNAKLLSLILIYFIYVFLTFIFSFITYFTHLIYKNYTSGHFFPKNNIDIQYNIILIIGIILTFILCILLTCMLSIKFSNGITMLIGVLWTITSFIAPNLKTLRYFIPNGYINVYTKLGFNNSIIIMITIFILYSLIIYGMEDKMYENVEY